MYQLPVFRDHKLFEEFVCELFNELENSGNTHQIYGRLGQKQNGVDIYSNRNKTAIQCKLKNINQPQKKIKKDLKKDIENELIKLVNFQNDFNRYIIASTYSDDKDIQDFIVEIKNRNNYNFEILYWGWDTIVMQTNFYKTLLWKYFDIINYNSNEKTKTLIYVSLGGTCRDPLAKAITMKILSEKKLKQNLIIKTLGIYPGSDISFATKYVIKEFYNQIVPSDLKPNSINPDLIENADLILLMDSYIAEMPRSPFPSDKTYLFTDFFGINDIIEDPFPDGRDFQTIERYKNTAKKIELILTNNIQYLITVLGLDE